MSQDSPLLDQIQFARHNFDNLQSLIRSSDTKAAVRVTIVVFLAASALQVTKDAVAVLGWTPCRAAFFSTIFSVSIFGLLMSVVWSFVTVQRVLQPRGASHYASPQMGRDLMWQDHVLKHQTNSEYFTAVRAASDETILQNLTDQVFELAYISKAKMDALQNGSWARYIVFCSWIASIASGLILVRLK